MISNLEESGIKSRMARKKQNRLDKLHTLITKEIGPHGSYILMVSSDTNGFDFGSNIEDSKIGDFLRSVADEYDHGNDLRTARVMGSC